MQTFGPFVELFSIHGIDMLGNMDNGAVVGLTSEATEVCRRVLEERADADDIARVDERLFEFLARNGFFEREFKHAHPQSAYVHVTQRCNLDCVGCYSASILRNRAEDPTLEQLARVFRQLAENGVSKVNISGGEPFLRDDLHNIARIANGDCGIANVNVVTNGTITGQFDLRAIAPWVESVTVSIDGPSAQAPAYIRREQRFETLMATVGRLQEAGIDTRILPTLHARNIDDVPAYVQLAKQLGVGLSFSLLSCPPEHSDMARLMPNESELEHLAELPLADFGFGKASGALGIGLQARRACGAGLRQLSIDVDGGVYPCHMLQSSQFFMGNLFSEELSEILSRSREGVARWLLPVEEVESCSDCEYSLACGGGCRARAINSGAGPAGTDPYCSLSKGFYRKMFSALSAGVSRN